MAQPVDFSIFNFSAEEIRAIRELAFDAVVTAPELEFLHSFHTGIVYDKEIGWIGEGSIVGKKNQGCRPAPQPFNIATRKLIWSPKRWGVELEICYTDLESTMAVYSMKQGVDRADLTSTDYMAIVVDVLSKAIKKMLWRFVWFGDVDAENVSNGGVITDGIDTEYFDLIDGFWKQLTAAASGSTQLVPISANAAATTEDQYAQLTGQMAYDTLNKMHLKASILQRNQEGNNFYCTQSFADAYMTYLEGKELESTYTNLVDGIRALNFRGYNVIPIQIWDELISSYEDQGTTLNNPHRVVFLPKEVLGIGLSSESAIETVDVWYEKKLKLNCLRAEDAIDAKVLNDKLFMLAI